jgi:hypothetical protein
VFPTRCRRCHGAGWRRTRAFAARFRRRTHSIKSIRACATWFRLPPQWTARRRSSDHVNRPCTCPWVLTPGRGSKRSRLRHQANLTSDGRTHAYDYTARTRRQPEPLPRKLWRVTGSATRTPPVTTRLIWCQNRAPRFDRAPPTAREASVISSCSIRSNNAGNLPVRVSGRRISTPMRAAPRSGLGLVASVGHSPSVRPVSRPLGQSRPRRPEWGLIQMFNPTAGAATPRTGGCQVGW